MKKYFSMISLALLSALTFVSCSVETDEEAGGTTVEKMAGIWDVQVDAYDEDGNLLYEDPYGLGIITVITYNTASNTADSMYISDQGNFWGLQAKVAIDYANATFSAPAGTAYDPAGTGNVDLLNGKILYNQGHNENGMACDSINFNVKFDDDSYGFVYNIHGVRHSGF